MSSAQVFEDAVKSLKKQRKKRGKDKSLKSKIGTGLLESASKTMSSQSQKKKSFPKLRKSIAGPKGPSKRVRMKRTRVMDTDTPNPGKTPGYARPHAKIGTNIKNKVRKSNFGMTQYVEGVRNFESGQTKSHQIGTQHVSTGANRREVLGGTFGQKVKKRNQARSLFRKGTVGKLNNRKG